MARAAGRWLALLPALLLAATPLAAQTAPGEQVSWAFEQSDLQAEEGWLFGELDNGMRYAIRKNDRPDGTALVHMNRIEPGHYEAQVKTETVLVMVRNPE